VFDSIRRRLQAKAVLGVALLAVLLGGIGSPTARAQINNVQVPGVTATQAILTYVAPNSSPCSVAVSESPGLSPLVGDVDPVKFPGSNSDARFPTLNRGGRARFFVVGTVPKPSGIYPDLAADGNFYSRTLHQNAPHYYQITCGAYTATGSFQTQVLPTGKTYGEPQPIVGAGRPWAASLNYTVGDLIEDSNYNIEQARSSGTSSASVPSWNASLDGTTADNTVTWENLGPYSVLAGRYSHPIPTYAGANGTSNAGWSDPNWSTIDPVFGTKIEHMTMAGEDAGQGGFNSQLQYQNALQFGSVGTCANWSNASNVNQHTQGTPATYTAGTQDKCYISTLSAWPGAAVAPDFFRIYVYGKSSAQDGVNNVLNVCVTLDGVNCAPSVPVPGQPAYVMRQITLPSAETTTANACLPIVNCATAISPIDTWANPPLNVCQIFSSGNCSGGGNSNFGLLFWKNGTDATTTLSIYQIKIDIQVSPFAGLFENGFEWSCSLNTVNDANGNTGYLCISPLGVSQTGIYWVGTGASSGQVRWLGSGTIPAGTFNWQNGTLYYNALNETFDNSNATGFYTGAAESSIASTTGSTVNYTAGKQFPTSGSYTTAIIGGVPYTIASLVSATQFTTTTSIGTHSGYLVTIPGWNNHSHLLKCQLPASGSSFYNASSIYPNAQVCVGTQNSVQTGTWADLTPAPNTLDVLVKAFDPSFPTAFLNVGSTPNGSQGHYLPMTTLASTQDSPGYLAVYDLSQPGCTSGSPTSSCIAAGTAVWKWSGWQNASLTNSGARWCVYHATHDTEWPNPPYSGTNEWEMELKGGESESPAGIWSEPFQTYLTSAINDAPATCPQGNTSGCTQENISVFNNNPTEGWGTATLSVDGVTLTRVAGNHFISQNGAWVGLTGIFSWSGNPSGTTDTIISVSGDSTLVLASPLTGAPTTAGGISYWIEDNLYPLQAGDILAIGSELLEVTAVNGTTLTVIRGFDKSPTATHPAWSPASPTNGILNCQCGAITLNTTLGGYGSGLANVWWDFVDDPHGTNSGCPTNCTITMTGQKDNITFHNSFSLGSQLSEAGYTACAGGAAGAECDGQSGRPMGFMINDSSKFAGVEKFADGNAWEKHPGAPEALNATLPIEKTWGLDSPFLDADPDSCTTTSTPACIIANVTGSLWLVTLPQTFGGQQGLNLKKQAILSVEGAQPLMDVSGPGSSIGGTAADNYKICIPYLAGECYSGSAAAVDCVTSTPPIGCQTKVYVNAPTLGTTAQCTVPNIYRSGIVCIENLPTISAAQQVRISRQDYAGQSYRQLSHRLQPMVGANGGITGQALPDGKWAIFGSAFIPRADNILVEVPPWVTDSENRGDFLQIPISLNPPAALGANNAIVEFGYDTNFYCTSRQEACVAAASTYSQANPFYYENSDVTNSAWNGNGVSCSTSCTIIVPVIPDHVVYWRWKYRNSSNGVIATGPMQVEAAY